MTAHTYLQYDPGAGTRTLVVRIVQPVKANPEPFIGVVGWTWMG